LGCAFADAGHDLYLVGGSARDALLGRVTHDLDLTTDARPDEIKRLIETVGPDSIYTVGERFGTIGSVFGDRNVEITTYRSEAYSPHSRKPEVAFGTTLAGDLSRRDFTINALARPALGGEIVDLFGGLADLRRRLVRAVGKPDERFSEDPLRLLRAVRFCAQLGFSLADETRDAIQRRASMLRIVSRERVLDELNRLLLAPHPARGLRLLADLGLADEVLPELVALRQTSQGRRMKDVFEHTLAVVENTRPDLALRWSALLHDVGKPRTLVLDGPEVHFPGHELVGETLARDILGRLRMDHRTIERVSRLVGLHMRANQYEDSWTDGAVRRLVRDVGDDLELLLSLSTADVTSYRQAKRQAAADRVARLRERVRRLEEEESIQSIKSPLDGVELMAMFGRGPGPWIRDVKDYLLDLVLEGKLGPDDKETAAELARKLLAEPDEADRRRS
jgi:poly(A) polymerase